MRTKTISLPDVVGKGYKSFWQFKGRYRVVKGSRASKKSKTAALWYIYNLMKYPNANLLVIRKVFRTLQDSCYKELQWAANRLGVPELWDFKKSPLEATYLPTGQKIYFRGLDDPLKITSITVTKGYLCWAWIEEAYEIMEEKDFDMLDESIRGAIPEPLFKQITLIFNPWNEHHWIKKRFFDANDPDIFATTTNYTCNEWLDSGDKKMFERMKERNPRRYQVAGLGDWGIVDGLVYENWKEQTFRKEDLQHCETFAGLDFGYTNDPSAFVLGFIDQKERRLYIYDEFYKYKLSNRAIADEIKRLKYQKERITADSAEPKSIAELKSFGLRVSSAKKGADSIRNGVQFIQDFEIIIHPRCVNFLTEVSNYTFKKDKFGKMTNEPEDNMNHLMDALRYALEGFTSKTKVKTFKGGL